MSSGSRNVMVGSIAFLTGLVAGAGAGVLTAPRSGVRTRQQIRDFVGDVGQRATSLVEDAKKSVGDTLEWSKRLVG